jgi:hypothetical protein
MTLSSSSETEQLAKSKLYIPDKNNNNSGSHWDINVDSGAFYTPYIKTVPAAPESSNGWISFSKPSGSARGNNCYFRYSYRVKDSIKHKHIRGGNISRFKAIINAKRVSDKIKNGDSIDSIIRFIEAL